jgi:aqualysin 1
MMSDEEPRRARSCRRAPGDPSHPTPADVGGGRAPRWHAPPRLTWLPLLALALVGCQDHPSTAPARPETVELRPDLQRSAPNARLGDIPNRYIIALRDGVASTAAASQQLVTARRGRIHRVYRHALNGFAVTLDSSEADALRQDPAVAFVVPDQYVSGSATRTPVASWGLDRIDQRALPLDGSFTYTTTGAGVSVYILDSGIRVTHAEFRTASGTSRAAHGWDFIDDDADASDCAGHGTHVAGTVGGRSYGVAEGVRLVSVRVLDCTGTGTWSGIIAGMDWVVANHQAGQPAVVNMSLGGPASLAVDAAVQRLVRDGVVAVAAAGNDYGRNACELSPARSPEALTVGATDATDTRAAFSNVGDCLDLFAPGVGITSAWHRSDSDAARLDGTSMAAPHVAGVTALYLQRRPTATPAEASAAVANMATTGVVRNPPAFTPNRLLYAVLPPTSPPVVAVNGPYLANEGATIAFSSAGSSAPAGYPLTYQWSFGDGGSSTLANPARSYADNRTYTVTLTVTAGGLSSTATTTATVANVAPTATFTVPATALVGRSYTLALDGTDAGAADRSTLLYALDCGQGAGFTPWSTTVRTVTCPARVTAGPVVVQGKVRDKDGGETPYSRQLVVRPALPFTVISPGFSYTCGVTTENRAYCWGSNYFGALGTGTTTGSLTPVPVTGGLSFSAVRASDFHTCGIATDGRAYCWGINEAGRLGDGTEARSDRPVAVSGGLAFRQLALGKDHTCGVTTDHRAFCWGYNGVGQLGNGSTIDSRVPVPVAGGLALVSISASDTYTCGVTSDGTAHCWGDNGKGQFGNGTVVGSLVPVRAGGALRFQTLSTAVSHACGVTTGAQAYCWGFEDTGALGTGYVGSRTVLAPVPVAGGLAFAGITTRDWHTCGTTTSGAAYCWGKGLFGVLGTGTTDASTVPARVVGDRAFAGVIAHKTRTCGWTPWGEGYCWGSNSSGALGDGSTTRSSVPVAISAGSGLP